MRVAVLVKQVPVAAELELRDGRLVREGVRQEVNAYCRRANAKAIELAGPDGEVVVLTMGPPSAADALREMIAAGADRGIHLSDPAFAGSDTLATARALAAAIRVHGPFDLVLAGSSTVDSDTGQVPPQVAALLDIPFLPVARELDIRDGRAEAKLETEDGYRWASSTLPAVISAAERLCRPSKSDELAAPDTVVRVGAAELGLAPDEVGVAGSPTTVGPARTFEVTRQGLVVDSVGEVVAVLEERGAFGAAEPAPQVPQVAPPSPPGGPELWCYVDRSDPRLLGEAAHLASQIGATVVALQGPGSPEDPHPLGADRCVQLAGSIEADDIGPVLADLAAQSHPWGVLFPSSPDGRTLAATVATLNGWGLTGDAIRVEPGADGGLVAWKSALGGRLEVPILSRSPVQLATVRTGVAAARRPRASAACPTTQLTVPARGRTATTGSERTDDAAAELQGARSVIGVGLGVDPADYPLLEVLRAALGNSAIAATRKVTDRGWVPRNRQVGITGQVIAPLLYIAIGVSGRFNHTMAVQASRTVLAINSDPQAEIFAQADVGLVGDWRDVVPELARLIAERSAAPTT